MDQKALKTSWKQRIIIIVIALILLFSTIAMYIGLILGATKNPQAEQPNNAQSNPALTKIATAYSQKMQELQTNLSKEYTDVLAGYKSEVKAFNAASATKKGLQTKDLKVGTGNELTAGFTKYLSFYVGFCPSGKVFDSSFDSFEKPTSLKAPLYDRSLIEGWNQGVVGMKLGGVRLITTPSELAYKGQTKLCDDANDPLRFIILAVQPNDAQTKLLQDIEKLSADYQAAVKKNK